MKVTFKYTILAEYRRLLFNFWEIKTGFYKSHGFLVSTQNNGDITSVVVPTLKKFNTPKFLKSIKKSDVNNYTTLKSSVYPTLYKYIKKQNPISTNNYVKEWENKQKKFEKVVNTIFKQNELTVLVYITKYGTVASYTTKYKNKVIIYLRKDADISQVAFCILAYFVHSQNKKLPWKTKQQVIDFLMTSTKVKKLFSNYKSIVEQIDVANPKKALEESNLMYEKLGVINPIFTEKENQFYVNSKLLDFSYSENVVFAELFKNSNFYTPFDEISNALWGDDYSQFSLQAIAKVIQRIREKIEAQGVEYNCIKTKRKVGYMLIN